MFDKIASMADSMQGWMTEQRRDFHKHAEAGWLEMRTSSIIARQLTDLGYEVLVGRDVCDEATRMGVPSQEVLEEAYVWAKEHGADPEFIEKVRGGFTGVIGILRCGEGPVVAMRFDIDALGVVEDSSDEHLPHREGFASITNGVMHACGHDGHATIGLGVAKVLMDCKDQLRGTVKLIFQPAEEGVRGAKSIVEKGHLDDVNYFLASHLGGGKQKVFDIGAIASDTPAYLATTKLDATFHGHAVHAAASPETGKNTLLAGATALLNIHAIPRHSGGDSRVNVGRFTGGTGRNVISDTARLELEVRGETTEVVRYMEDYAVRILKSAAAMHDCTCDISYVGAALTALNDKGLTACVADVAREKFGLALMPEPKTSSKASGSEDATYMMNRVQEQGGEACYFFTLTTCPTPPHSTRFDFGEEALPAAVKVFCGVAYELLGEK